VPRSPRAPGRARERTCALAAAPDVVDVMYDPKEVRGQLLAV
jgi:hypothetical protein